MADKVNSYDKVEDQSDNDFAKLREWLQLCVSRWYWFVISILCTLSVALIYILVTPPVYTRNASILIKDDDNGSSLSNQFGAFSDFGITKNNTNLYNEMLSLSSPSYMQDVVRRLHLDMNYEIDGTFHRLTLYGKNLPINVVLPDLHDDETVSFELRIQPNNAVELSNFVHNGYALDDDKVLKAPMGRVVQTPIGKMLITPTRYYTGSYTEPIFITRNTIYNTTSSYIANLTVGQDEDKSSVVNLSFDDVSLQRADDVLNTLYQVYNQKWIEDINQQAISTSNFIDEELQTIERELGNVDADISSYKSEHLVPDVQTASTLYMNKAEQTSTQMLDLENQLFMAKYIKRQLEQAGQFRTLPANSGIDNAAVAAQINAYNERVTQRNNLVANSSEANPLIKDLDQTLAASRQAILASIDNVMATLNNRMRDLQGSEAKTKTEIQSNPSQAKYLLSVERQQKVKEQLYLFLLQKREENQLSKAFTAYNTKMLNPPAGSEKPSKPVKINLFFIALALGLFIPMLTLFIVNNMDSAVRYRKDLDKLTLPFIGEIPLSYRPKRGLARLFHKKRKEVREIVVREKGRNEVNEAFRVVRTNMEFILGKEGTSKTIMFTSANAGSGKTFISMNLATSFAIKGKRVVVVDLDMRKASLSTFVNSPTQGIADYLSERVDDINSIIVKGQTHENLDVLPVGTMPPNPTELLFSDRFETIIDELKSRYEYVFIDCPPLDIVADAAIINKVCDMTVYVIRSGRFDKRMLPDVERYYEERRYKNMALILNGTIDESNGYGYHRYGYSYGYSYGY